MVNERYAKYKGSYRKYREQNKEKIKEINKIYKDRNRLNIRKQNLDNYYKSNFGGNRAIVLERDNWTCVKCGMNNEQHILIFGKQITIDHIDGKGRYTKDKNNNLNNLQTLCLRCHGRKDNPTKIKSLRLCE